MPSQIFVGLPFAQKEGASEKISNGLFVGEDTLFCVFC